MQLRAWVILGLLAVGIVTAGWREYQRERQARVLAELRLHQQYQVNDSTVARLAATAAAKDSLGGLFIAADQLNGQLIAGFRLHVHAKETVLVHDTLPTTLLPDSTRVATFRDSTFAGTISGTVTAPPCCVPLRLQYTLQRPEFSPSVGFVRIGSAVAAVVSWQGEEVRVEAPFADLPRPVKRLGGGVEVMYLPTSGGIAARAFGLYRAPWGLEVQAGGQQQPNIPANLFVGIGKRW